MSHPVLNVSVYMTGSRRRGQGYISQWVKTHALHVEGLDSTLVPHDSLSTADSGPKSKKGGGEGSKVEGREEHKAKERGTESWKGKMRSTDKTAAKY